MHNGMLLYGNIESGRRPKYFEPAWGHTAYERYQIPLYLQEIRRLHESDYICWTPGFSYLALAMKVLAHRNLTIHLSELGSTLFSTIDKLEKLNRIHHLGLDLQKTEFHGIEIMPEMIWLAKHLHRQYKVNHSPRVDYHLFDGRTVVTRCYQSTGYAFSSSGDLAEWTSKSHFSVQGVFFSKQAVDEPVNLMGNRLTLFDPNRFLKESIDAGCKIIPISSTSLTYEGTIDCHESFFIAHRFSKSELIKFAELCKTCGLKPDLAPCTSAGELLFGSNAKAKRSDFSTVTPPDPNSDPAVNSRVIHDHASSFDFLDERILKRFLENANWTTAELESMEFVGDLKGPFTREHGHCYLAMAPSAAGIGDSMADSRASAIIVTEDDQPLQIPHAPHDDIRQIGMGRYSHWGDTMYFSTRDNSDPNSNGRRYRLRRGYWGK